MVHRAIVHLVGLRKHAHRANGAKRPVAPGGVAHDLRPGAIGLRCTGATCARNLLHRACTGHLCTISSRWTGHVCTRLWRIVEDLVHLIHLCSGGLGATGHVGAQSSFGEVGGGAHGPGAPYSLGRESGGGAPGLLGARRGGGGCKVNSFAPCTFWGEVGELAKREMCTPDPSARSPWCTFLGARDSFRRKVHGPDPWLGAPIHVHGPNQIRNWCTGLAGCTIPFCTSCSSWPR